MDVRGSIPSRGGDILCHLDQTDSGNHQDSYRIFTVDSLSLRIKRLDHKADHPLPSTAKLIYGALPPLTEK